MKQLIQFTGYCNVWSTEKKWYISLSVVLLCKLANIKILREVNEARKLTSQKSDFKKNRDSFENVKLPITQEIWP